MRAMLSKNRKHLSNVKLSLKAYNFFFLTFLIFVINAFSFLSICYCFLSWNNIEYRFVLLRIKELSLLFSVLPKLKRNTKLSIDLNEWDFFLQFICFPNTNMPRDRDIHSLAMNQLIFIIPKLGYIKKFSITLHK